MTPEQTLELQRLYNVAQVQHKIIDVSLKIEEADKGRIQNLERSVARYQAVTYNLLTTDATGTNTGWETSASDQVSTQPEWISDRTDQVH